MPKDAPSRLAYSIPEACRATSLGRSLLYEEIRKRNLPVFKVGTRTLIHADDLEAWLDRHRSPSATPYKAGMPPVEAR